MSARTYKLRPGQPPERVPDEPKAASVGNSKPANLPVSPPAPANTDQPWWARHD